MGLSAALALALWGAPLFVPSSTVGQALWPLLAEELGAGALTGDAAAAELRLEVEAGAALAAELRTRDRQVVWARSFSLEHGAEPALRALVVAVAAVLAERARAPADRPALPGPAAARAEPRPGQTATFTAPPEPPAGVLVPAGSTARAPAPEEEAPLPPPGGGPGGATAAVRVDNDAPWLWAGAGPVLLVLGGSAQLGLEAGGRLSLPPVGLGILGRVSGVGGVQSAGGDLSGEALGVALLGEVSWPLTSLSLGSFALELAPVARAGVEWLELATRPAVFQGESVAQTRRGISALLGGGLSAGFQLAGRLRAVLTLEAAGRTAPLEVELPPGFPLSAEVLRAGTLHLGAALRVEAGLF